MLARHKWLLVTVAIAFFCVSFAWTIWVTLAPGRVPAEKKELSDTDLNGPKAATEQEGAARKDEQPADFATQVQKGELLNSVSPPQPELRLLTGADLIQTVVSGGGDVVATATRSLPPELVGKTRQEVETIHPQWRVVGFSPERITVRIPETHMEKLYGHLNFLGIAEGKIAVFRGKPGVYGRLERITDISATNLPEFEVRNLEKGIPYEGEEELLLLLESFSERME